MAPSKQKPGTLKSVRKIAQQPTGRQVRMPGPPRAGRQDSYDILLSPERLMIPQPKETPAELSPLRKPRGRPPKHLRSGQKQEQKSTATNAKSVAYESEEATEDEIVANIAPQTRRSPRKSAAAGLIVEATLSNSASNSASASTSRQPPQDATKGDTSDDVFHETYESPRLENTSHSDRNATNRFGAPLSGQGKEAAESNPTLDGQSRRLRSGKARNWRRLITSPTADHSAGLQIQVPRVSEVQFSNTPLPQNTSGNNDDNSNKRATKRRKVNKNAGQQSSDRITAKREDDGDDEFDIHGQTGSDFTYRRRLFGQRMLLAKIFSDGNKLSKRDDIDLEDQDVRALILVTTLAKTQLGKLTAENSRPESGLPPAFVELRARINGLCNANHDYPTDISKRSKAENIYSHLFPCLVKLLAHMTKTYERMDEPLASVERSISIPHLRNLSKFMEMILMMGRFVKKKYIRPDTKKALVRPVDEQILTPLKEAHKAFEEYLAKDQAQQDQTLQQVRLERQLAYEETARNREREEQLNYERLRGRWGRLHEYRRHVEGGIIDKRKLLHLQYRELEPEADGNGDLFERVELFGRRVGPTPAVIQRVKNHGQWPPEALVALTDGLRQWAGDEMVFERIMKQYCGRNGPLNAYNVAEIVVTAALMQPVLRKVQRDELGYVEDWVEDIPLWTETGWLLGKENDAVDDDDDDDDDGDDGEDYGRQG